MPRKGLSSMILAVALAGVCMPMAGADEPAQKKTSLVVIAAEGPSWNVRFLAAAIQRDDDLKSATVLAQGDTNISDQIAECSVLILVDLSGEVFQRDPNLAKSIRQLLEHGGGLIVMTNKPWADESPLVPLLPVTLAKEGEEPDDAPALSHPTITSEGLRSSFLRFVDDPMRNQQLWRETLGPSFGPPIFVTPRPDAKVLAIDPLRKVDGQPVPLIAAGQFGKGHVIFLNNSQTWRWRKDPLGNYHDRFCRRITRFAAGNGGD